MSENLKTEIYEREVTPAERLFTRSPFSVVTMVVRIKGNVSEEMLKSAVYKVQQRHPLLRARIKDDEDEQWFTTEEVQEIPVEIRSRQSESDWIRIHEEACKIPYEFDSRPAFRFILIQAPDVNELIILCHPSPPLFLTLRARDNNQHCRAGTWHIHTTSVERGRGRSGRKRTVPCPR